MKQITVRADVGEAVPIAHLSVEDLGKLLTMEVLGLSEAEIDYEKMTEEGTGAELVEEHGRGYEFTCDGGEYLVYETYEQAEMDAMEQVKEDLEEDPSFFQQDWLEGHFDEDRYLEDIRTDINGWVQESPESYTSFIEDADPEGEDGEYSEEQIDEMTEKYIEDLKGRVIDWLKGDLGYEGKNLADHISPYINISEAAQDAIDVDGVAHFLARYDGDELDLGSGAVAYRTN